MKKILGPMCAMLIAVISASHPVSAAAQAESARLVASSAMMAELSTVHAAIQAAGARWTANDNPILRLPPEQRQRRLGLLKRAVGSKASVVSFPAAASAALPASLDWRNYNGQNYVTAVKDQGNCGSCWAFSTIGGLESYVLRTQSTPGANVDLSEQIVISCGGAGNCENGGYPDSAASFMQSTGVGPESAYPYTAADGSCSQASSGWQLGAERIGKAISVPGTNVTPTTTAIKSALFAYGPLPTTMAVYSDFFSYTSGVYSYTSGSLAGGHAVLIVGYDDANQCFIVKNSWNSSWGEGGYFRIAYSQMSNSVGFGADTIAFSSAAPTALSVAITSPANNASVNGGITVSGTAAETVANVLVSQVQVQVDSGAFLPASGTTKWSYGLNTAQLGIGKHIITVHAIDTTGSLASVAVTINVTTVGAPLITSASSATVTLGAAFRYTITATNNPTSFRTAGLPAGLGVSMQTGAISGAPTALGAYNATISAANALGSGSQTLSLAVLPAPPVITSTGIASGVVGKAFAYAVTATNSPTSFNAVGLPSGLLINTNTGAISGAPTTAGIFTVMLRASNQGGTGARTLVLTVAPAPPVIASTGSASGAVGKSFAYAVTATNNPTSFSAVGLPSGLLINANTGAISGTPTTAGIFTVTLRASNQGGAGTMALAITVVALPVITSASSVAGALGAAFGYAITATNSPTSFSASGLPSGLSLNAASGVISGTPTTMGSFSVALGAANAAGTGKIALALTIKVMPPVITSVGTATSLQFNMFGYKITATNSPTSYNATGLPGSLSVNRTSGLISGLVSKAGVSRVTISATNAGGTGTQTLVITAR